MKTTRFITRAGVIAALYVILTLLFYLTSFSTATVQFRISEALMVLPLFMAEAIPGLWIGCLLANVIGGSVVDIFFGSLATLIAATLTYICGRLFKRAVLRLTIGAVPPIVVNALMVPLTFTVFVGNAVVYWAEVLNVLVGQAAVVCALGVPLYFGVKSHFSNRYRHRL